MKSEIDSHVCLPEPELLFHPDRPRDRHIHPLMGLVTFGPYSKQVLPDPVRVATIVPNSDGAALFSFMKELRAPAKATERLDYLPDYPGFEQVFRLRMEGAPSHCHVALDPRLEREFQQSARPHITLAEHLVRAIQRLEASRHDFDVLFVYLPQRWSAGYVGTSEEDFDLHDHLKAMTARRAIPLQIVREDKALAYEHRASVMWRIALALYAKAGGVPWKLAEADPEAAYIGISYALRPMATDNPHFVTCCSQVFDAEGAGLEFVAYDAREARVERKNPFLSRNEMFRVMTRSMDLYRRQHAGRSPRRVFVHKTTEFKYEEVDGAMEALHLCEAVDLIQVVQNVGWRASRIEHNYGSRKGKPAGFPVARGSLVGLGARDALLWVHGDAAKVGKRPSYFQGARSTPQPLRLVRYAGHGTWDDSAQSILALSKMDWNNDALYDHLPVTLGYAKVLARVVKRMPLLGTAPYQFRYFI